MQFFFFDCIDLLLACLLARHVDFLGGRLLQDFYLYIPTLYIFYSTVIWIRADPLELGLRASALIVASESILPGYEEGRAIDRFMYGFLFDKLS